MKSVQSQFVSLMCWYTWTTTRSSSLLILIYLAGHSVIIVLWVMMTEWSWEIGRNVGDRLVVVTYDQSPTTMIIGLQFFQTYQVHRLVVFYKESSTVCLWFCVLCVVRLKGTYHSSTLRATLHRCGAKISLLDETSPFSRAFHALLTIRKPCASPALGSCVSSRVRATMARLVARMTRAFY
jgi:hypothetical protein